MTLQKFLVVASLLRRAGVSRGAEPAPRTADGTGRSSSIPATLTKPLADEWPTFAGDYTSRRYSTLKQINTTNVKNLTLAWMTPVLTGPRGGVPPTIIGGVGTREFTGGTIKGAVLQVGGILYVTAPRQRVGARRARRPRNLALLLEDARRHPYRQSRRGHLVQLSVLRDARTTTWSRSMRRPARKTGTSRSPISMSSISRRRRRSSSTTTSSSARATTSTAPDSFRPSIRRPESCSGSSTRCR